MNSKVEFNLKWIILLTIVLSLLVFVYIAYIQPQITHNACANEASTKASELYLLSYYKVTDSNASDATEYQFIKNGRTEYRSEARFEFDANNGYYDDIDYEEFYNKCINHRGIK